MDVLPLPESRRNFIKASSEQQKILLAGFEASDVCHKDHVAALHEATGLMKSPQKWIISWFSRQRRKIGRTRDPKQQKDATTESEAPMTIQEITNFKTEHSDENLSMTMAQEAGPNTESKPATSKKRPKTRKSTKKRDINPAVLSPDSSTSSLKDPLISVPLASRSVLPPAGQPLIQAKAQVADPDSPTSTFLLREMVPQLYQPHGLSLAVANNAKPASSTSLDVAATVVRMALPSSTESSTPVLHTNPLAQNVDYKHADPSSITNDVPQHTPATFYSWQLQESITFDGTTQGKNQNKVVKHTREADTTLETLPTLSSVQESRQGPRSDHSLRPLLPVDPQYPLDYYRAYEIQLQRQSEKENQRPRSRTRSSRPSKSSSGQQNLPPLLTTTDLTKARHSPPATHVSNPTSAETATHSVVQSLPEPYLEPQLDNQPLEAFFYDPLTESLKHLNVLAPFPDEDLPADEIMRRLLDERLAIEDSFQAAMGLVFASQLGLSWDFT
ncbi:hypothetical protein H0H92_007501 [Tricholoma furcatifolium]|nr:hypothetical protein H0H92_007501 [Tricholoma furcatifolium]